MRGDRLYTVATRTYEFNRKTLVSNLEFKVLVPILVKGAEGNGKE
jgi:hypothetical protein